MFKKLQLVLLAGTAALLTGCGDSSIELVKSSNFPDQPMFTMDVVLDGAFDNGEWVSEEINGKKYVTYNATISKQLNDTFLQSRWPYHASYSDGDYRKIIKNNTTEEFKIRYNSALDKAGRNKLNEISKECDSLRTAIQSGSLPKEEDTIARAEFDNLLKKYSVAAKEVGDSAEYKAVHKEYFHTYVSEYFFAVGSQMHFQWVISSDGEDLSLTSYGNDTWLKNKRTMEQIVTTINAM